jgi:hypothetical protein
MVTAGIPSRPRSAGHGSSCTSARRLGRCCSSVAALILSGEVEMYWSLSDRASSSGARGRPPGTCRNPRARSLLLAGATTSPTGRGARAPGKGPHACPRRRDIDTTGVRSSVAVSPCTALEGTRVLPQLSGPGGAPRPVPSAAAPSRRGSRDYQRPRRGEQRGHNDVITRLWTRELAAPERRVLVEHILPQTPHGREATLRVFADREDCFLAAFEHALSEAILFAREAYEGEPDWREGTRSALAQLLMFIEHAYLARLLTVESLVAGEKVLRRRAQVLDELARVIDRGRLVHDLESYPPPLAGSGVVL